MAFDDMRGGAICTVDAKTLQQAVAESIRNYDAKSTLPILGSVHVQVAGDALTITATDLDQQHSATIGVDGERDHVSVMDARQLRAALKGVKRGQTVTLTPSGVVVAGAFISIDCQPVEDWPRMVLRNFDMARIDTAELRDMLRHTLPCVSKDNSRYYLHGCYLHTTRNRLAMVATDGHRLSLHKSDIAPHDAWGGMMDEGVIIPTKAATAMLRALSVKGAPEHCHIGGTDTQFCLSVGDTIILSKVIDGTFPDYSRVIPDPKGAPRAWIDRDEAIDAVKRIIPLANTKGPRAIIECDAGQISLPRSASFPVHITGECQDMCFNARYLKGLLPILSGKRVRVCQHNEGDPAHITGDDSRLTVVLMPMLP